MADKNLSQKLDDVIQILSRITIPAVVPPVIPLNSADHDLLTKLNEKVDGLIKDVKEINDGTSYKINDHELRLRKLETWGFTAIGVLAALQFYFQYVR